MDENMSWYFDKNVEKFTSQKINVYDEDFEESNKMHGSQRAESPSCLTFSRSLHLACFDPAPPPLVSGSTAVNGLMYGNLPGLRMCAGDNVVWYTFGLGTEVDVHGVFFEGNTFQRQKTTRDIVNVFPHTTAVVTMHPNTPGESNRRCACASDASAELLELFRPSLIS